MRLVGFVMLHLARQSKLGQLLPVTSALVEHCLLLAACSPQQSGEEHFTWAWARFQPYHCNHFWGSVAKEGGFVSQNIWYFACLLLDKILE